MVIKDAAGLSPILARGMFDDHITSLARAGVTILLVEQRAHQAMQIADWCYVLVAGRVELNDAPAALLAGPTSANCSSAGPPPARTRPVTMRADRGRPPRSLVQAPDEHALVSRLAEHAIAVRPGTALGIPGTVRVSVPSQRGLRLLHSALRPTSGRPPAESCRRTGTGSP